MTFYLKITRRTFHDLERTHEMYSGAELFMAKNKWMNKFDYWSSVKKTFTINCDETKSYCTFV